MEETENGFIIRLTTLCTSAGALKPALWLKCLCEFAGVEPVEGMIYRERVLAKDKSGQLIPMEDYQDAR